MALNLMKGQRTSLTKDNPGLAKILVGLGWDVNQYDGQAAFDLDASAFLLGANGEIYRHDGGWNFKAVGSGFKGGLQALGQQYGN